VAFDVLQPHEKLAMALTGLQDLQENNLLA
jgi:hypothetical protein